MGVALMDADFEPDGWSAFVANGSHGEKGNAGCAIVFIAVFLIAIISKLAGC